MVIDNGPGWEGGEAGEDDQRMTLIEIISDVHGVKSTFLCIMCKGRVRPVRVVVVGEAPQLCLFAPFNVAPPLRLGGDQNRVRCCVAAAALPSALCALASVRACVLLYCWRRKRGARE